MPVFSQAFEMAVGQDGWARLDVMGNAIYQVTQALTRAHMGTSSSRAC